MALMTGITIASNSKNVRAVIESIGLERFDGKNHRDFNLNTWVIVNGDIMGITRDPELMYNELKKMKRYGNIDVHAAICWDHLHRELRISTESGRCVRPLYIIEGENKLVMDKYHVLQLLNSKCSWMNLVSGQYCHENPENSLEPAIEFLDVEEVNGAMLAMKFGDLVTPPMANIVPVRHTHLEIHPSLMFGVLASSIPFSDHNQGANLLLTISCLVVEQRPFINALGHPGVQSYTTLMP
jgi:DNA-directed RNA polymerase II subunit RPB2